MKESILRVKRRRGKERVREEKEDNVLPTGRSDLRKASGRNVVFFIFFSPPPSA